MPTSENTDIPRPDVYADAAEARLAEIEALGSMTGEQIDYLANLASLPGPEDGLECEGI